MSSPLDDRAYVSELDPGGILGLVEGFPDQCRQARRLALDADLPDLDRLPGCVTLNGMGGSAAGGDFVRAIFEASGGAPFDVVRNYAMPSWVGLGDLVFSASYSGDTEETLAAHAAALKAGARCVCVSGGGKLSAQASADPEQVLVAVPAGQPPRTAMGFLMVPVLVLAERLKLIPAQPYEACFDLLERCAAEWGPEAPFETNPAKQLAAAFHGKLPVIYGLGPGPAVVAARWKSQVNENSKSMAHVNAFPELCHNEIVGWTEAGAQGVRGWAGAILEFGDESEKMRTRAAVVEAIVGEKARFARIRARGEDLLSRLLSLAYFGDFVSVYLARLYGVDPKAIAAIDRLKAELAKVG